jgi:dephospho-CoA kinase
MKRICVTGGIACGKSSVGAFLRASGVNIIDADEVCHALLSQGGPLVEKIVFAFGEGVLSRDGGINRPALGRIVFYDSEKRLKLNELVHPQARQAINLWLKMQEAGRVQKNRLCARRAGIAAVLVPLVYEAGWEAGWDAIVCVASPLSIQIERLARKGFSRKEAAARVAAQMPLAEKMSKADYVIFNAGPLSGLRQQTALVFRSIKEQTEKRHGRKK